MTVKYRAIYETHKENLIFHNFIKHQWVLLTIDWLSQLTGFYMMATLAFNELIICDTTKNTTFHLLVHKHKTFILLKLWVCMRNDIREGEL